MAIVKCKFLKLVRVHICVCVCGREMDLIFIPILKGGLIQHFFESFLFRKAPSFFPSL